MDGEQIIKIAELKNVLSDWKEIIVTVKRVLLWEQHWHPTALLGINTIVFTLLWLIEPEFLVVVATLGLILALIDFTRTNIAHILYSTPEQWTIREDQDFEQVCTVLVNTKTKIDQMFSSYYKMKITNPKLYFTITLTSLFVLAWFGSTVNNYLIFYLAFMSLVCTPGIISHQLLHNWTDKLSTVVTSCVNQVRSHVQGEKASKKQD